MSLGGKGGSKIQNRKTQPCLVTFYDDPPMNTIDFDDFKEYCNRRLKLLRDIENLNESKDTQIVPNDIKALTKKNSLQIAGFAIDG